MKTAFVSVENNITTLGFRRMASVARSIDKGVQVCHVVPVRTAGILQRLKGTSNPRGAVLEIDEISAHLSESDIICFSCMSTHADYTKNLIRAIRARNRHSFIVWGGVHCIVDPEDAVKYADAVCIGEGEISFPELMHCLVEGKDHTGVRNFFFNNKGNIIRNSRLALQTPEQLEARPFPLYGDRELIYKSHVGFVPLQLRDYVAFEGLQYNAIWSMGCPNRCTYCGNSTFLKLDKGYGKLRYPSTDYIVQEIKRARERHPHLSSVTFHDDCFMAIPEHVLKDFAMKWGEEVAVPFAVHGLMSRYVRAEKMKILISAGMVRVRMGIQSGSSRMLKFYKRPDTVESIYRAVSIIKDHSKYMMPPSYDFIVENPVETSADIAATVRLMHNLPRPLLVNVFPLMVIPGTKLDGKAQREGLELPYINFPSLPPSLASLVVSCVALVRLPRNVIEYLLKRVANSNRTSRGYSWPLRLLAALLVTKRALLHVKFGNLANITSPFVLGLWRIRVVSLLNKRMLKVCSMVLEEPGSD